MTEKNTNIKKEINNDIILDLLETTPFTGWSSSKINSSFLNNSIYSKEGATSGNWTYNITSGFDSITKAITGYNLTNVSGLGFWYKGDGTNNYIYTLSIFITSGTIEA